MKYKTYNVEMQITITTTFAVRATDEDEASDKADCQADRLVKDVEGDIDYEVLSIETNTDHPDW